MNKQSLDNFNVWLEKVAKLPDKFIDTNLIMLVQTIYFLIIFGAIAVNQLTVVNRCIVPIPSSLSQ